MAVGNSSLYPANADLFQKMNVNKKRGPDDVIVIKRTVFPVFMSRWKGNSDAKPGSVMAAITLESVG